MSRINPIMKRRRSRRGFSIIEAIVAIVVISTAAPPILWSLREAQIDRVDPVLTSRARWLAVEKLEDVIADRHSVTRGYAYLVTGNFGAEGAVTDFTNFARSVAFNETEADLSTAGDGYMTVTVTVTWDDSSGTSRSLAIDTVLTDYTP